MALPLLGAFGCAAATEGPDVRAPASPQSRILSPDAGSDASPVEKGLRWGAPQALASDTLTELSGLVAGGDGSFWGHNDHGNAPWLYRVGADGAHLGRLMVAGASAVDWEDASALGHGDDRLLLIGDIGDNLGRRSTVAVHFLPWPGAGNGALQTVASLEFTYADGPKDAEGLAWDPLEDALYILTKRETPPRLYRLALPAERAGGSRGDAGSGTLGGNACSAEQAPAGAPDCPALEPMVAKRVARLELPPPPLSMLFADARRHLIYNLPTALDISRDGLRLAVLTYGALYLYDRRAGQGWQETLWRRPQVVRLPDLPQAEAVALHGGGRHATVGSEGPEGAIVHLKLPPRSVAKSR